jgi:low affinity Fe/Cu permease
MRPGGSSSFFNRFAKWTARAAGKPLAFFLAVITVVVWAMTILGFSTTWQLVINTVTTIVTFLMVFLMQNTQYRDSEAIQIKLDELIRVIEGAHNILLDLEELDENDLYRIRGEYQKLAEKARKDLKKGKGDTGVLEVKTQRKA